MPAYATSGTGNLTLNPILPAVLGQGDSVYVFGTAQAAGQPPTPGQIQAPNDANVQAETVTVGERSLAVALSSRPDGGAAPGASVMVVASANPGAAEIDVQNAPIDADGAYLTPSGSASYKITSWTGPVGPLGQYLAWAEFQPAGDRFMSLKVIANPNGVKYTAKITYV